MNSLKPRAAVGPEQASAMVSTSRHSNGVDFSAYNDTLLVYPASVDTSLVCGLHDIEVVENLDRLVSIAAAEVASLLLSYLAADGSLGKPSSRPR
jgi:hypothetical protein